LLNGFERAEVDTGETSIFVRWSGSGEPILLLHGFPQTHLMWHGVAPLLARRFTVVCADLRGYGGSGCPTSTPDHAPYAKRAMARDMLSVMERLGFPRFSVAGQAGCPADRDSLGAGRRPVHAGVLALVAAGPT
jgi:haloacetate dehalogenase